MAFIDVIAEMKADLANILPADGETIPDYPPDSINAYPFLLLYPRPGTYTIQAANNATHRATYGGDHVIVVEWATSRGDLAEAIEQATPIADAIPLTLFTGFMRDRFNNTVHHLRSVTCELFGPSSWDTTELFCVKFAVTVAIIEETTALA